MCRLSEPLLTAHDILILIALSSEYACANVQTHQSLHCWREKYTNRHSRQHLGFWYSDEGCVSKGAKIRDQYNQVPQLTQHTNRKVTNSQFYTISDMFCIFHL